jgi:hypothetical protein
MRPSHFFRAVVAAAALAVGTSALVAAPAGAAPSEITRAEVLAVTAAVRAETPTATPGAYTSNTLRAIQALAAKACSVEKTPGQYVYGVGAMAVQPGRGADGVVVTASLFQRDVPGSLVCQFGVITTAADASTLSGTGQLGSGAPFALSGEVAVTPPSIVQSSQLGGFHEFRASGQASQSINVVTSEKVLTPKTSKQKKAAKKKYTQRIKAAKKSYTKAVKKAGHSKSKKKAAQRAYAKKRATAKSLYKKSTATSKTVKKTSVRTTQTPFNVTAQDRP